MKYKQTTSFLCALALCAAAFAQPSGRQSWNQDWNFTKDGETRVLNLPHDWGVEQPFLQENPGETGKLAWWGQATYSKTLSVSADDLVRNLRLEVDGAFTNAKVYVNGAEAGGWPYGYASWAVELNPFLHEGDHLIEVKLDNQPESSRWYPGGGIYRNVWLTRSARTSVAHWGTFVKADAQGKVSIDITLRSATPMQAKVTTCILGTSAQVVTDGPVYDGRVLTQTLEVEAPQLWSPEHPALYVARTTVETVEGTDVYDTPFGFRDVEWRTAST